MQYSGSSLIRTVVYWSFQKPVQISEFVRICEICVFTAANTVYSNFVHVEVAVEYTQ